MAAIQTYVLLLVIMAFLTSTASNQELSRQRIVIIQCVLRLYALDFTFPLGDISIIIDKTNKEMFDHFLMIKIYVSYIHIHFFTLHGYITNSQYDHLQVGLIALHRHRRGHGFQSRHGSSLIHIFFSGFLFPAAYAA